jgi:glycosyltransferase involved in cell wall biosynthesis
MKKVAAIITCSNSQKYIRKTIDSILSQTYPNMDIIAVDDGSTDSTRSILESYAPRIRVLTHKENKNIGQPASLNRGIRETDAELIAFIDHDDVWHPQKIEKQVRAFEQSEDLGLVYTNGNAIDECGNVLHKLFNPGFAEKNQIGDILLDCYITCPTQVMIRAEVLHKVGLFQEDLLCCADHDLYIKLSEITQFYFLDESLVCYRRHPTQQSLKRQMWEDGYKILTRACERYTYPRRLQRKRKAVLNYRLGQYDLQHKNHRRGVLHLLAAGALDPLRAALTLHREFLQKVSRTRLRDRGGLKR